MMRRMFLFLPILDDSGRFLLKPLQSMGKTLKNEIKSHYKNVVEGARKLFLPSTKYSAVTSMAMTKALLAKKNKSVVNRFA